MRFQINFSCAARSTAAWESENADPASYIVERGRIRREPGVARSPFVRLPVASLGRLFVCSPWQLRPGDAARAEDRSVVLSRGAANIQPLAGLPRREAARPAQLDRRLHRRRIVGQKCRSRCRCVARRRYHLAWRRSLAASAHSSGSNGPRPCCAEDDCRPAREGGDTRGRPRQGTRTAWPPAIAFAAAVEQYSGAAGLPADTEAERQ